MIQSQPCFLLEKDDRGAVASSSDSHVLQLLRTALSGSSASSLLPFLKGASSVRWGVILKLYVSVISFHFSEGPAWSIDKHKPQSHGSSIPSGTLCEGRQSDSYLQDNLYLSNFLDVSSGHELTQANIRAAVQTLCRWIRVCKSLCRSCLTCPQPTVSLQSQSHSSVTVGTSTPRAGRAPAALLAHRNSHLFLPLMSQAPVVSRGNRLKRSHHKRIVQGMQYTTVERLLCCNDILFLWMLSTRALLWSEERPRS